MNITELPPRMASKVIVTAECWLWTGAINSKGYGVAWIDGKAVLAHRHSFLLAKGEIPDGKQIDHLCMVTTCVNPAHLEAVTQLENMRRRFAAQTHCRHGHEFTPANTYVRERADHTARECRTCRTEKPGAAA